MMEPSDLRELLLEQLELWDDGVYSDELIVQLLSPVIADTEIVNIEQWDLSDPFLARNFDRVVTEQIEMAADSQIVEYGRHLGAVMEMNPNRDASGRYWVWPLVGDKPMAAEGPWGPYSSLARAKTYARIGATEGKHDRAVSVGRDPNARSFEIVRRYRRGDGQRLI